MKRKISSIIIGLLFIIGAAFYVINHFFGLDNLSLFFDGWWTVFIIVPSIIGLFKRGGRILSFCVLLFGLCLFAKHQSWLPGVSAALADVSVWQMIVAVLLLFVGLSIIASAIFRPGRNFGKKVVITADEIKDGSIECTFGERVIDFSGCTFSGFDLDSVFGSVTLDLRQAIIEADCEISADSVFGSVIILAGDNANFVVDGSSVFGSAECRKQVSAQPVPTVHVCANAVFGSVEVK